LPTKAVIGSLILNWGTGGTTAVPPPPLPRLGEPTHAVSGKQEPCYRREDRAVTL